MLEESALHRAGLLEVAVGHLKDGTILWNLGFVYRGQESVSIRHHLLAVAVLIVRDPGQT